jgi:ubiquinone/menaquinone biosynthesis C-methylase UbiE
MKKLYQTQWHGVQFKEFASHQSLEKIATKEFYDKFYQEFFKKYQKYDDISKNWIEYKINIAKYIESIIKDKKNILSIGCGIGIVENYLSKQNNQAKITAIEPSKNVSKWLKENINIELYDGYFPQCLPEKQFFDFAYANSVDYVFNREEYLVFLKSVIEYGITDFLIISSSSYNTKTLAKEFVKSLLETTGFRKKSDRGQFWGYLRSSKEQENILLEAGFKDIKITKSSKNTLFIRAKA